MARIPTGMAAVIGGETAELEKSLSHFGLFAANYNGGGQTVVAGELSSLSALAENPPTGSRVIALQVAGAFHTTYMESAVATLAEAAASITSHPLAFPLYTNRDGSRVDESHAVEYLVDQVARPVRWDRCMESFAKDGIQGMMELAPAGALVGLAKRALKGVPTVGITTPDDIALAHEMVVNS